MRCLNDGEWLNDEIINVSMALLQVRARVPCLFLNVCALLQMLDMCEINAALAARQEAVLVMLEEVLK